jgi:hypothetical protein
MFVMCCVFLNLKSEVVEMMTMFRFISLTSPMHTSLGKFLSIVGQWNKSPWVWNFLVDKTKGIVWVSFFVCK